MHWIEKGDRKRETKVAFYLCEVLEYLDLKTQQGGNIRQIDVRVRSPNGEAKRTPITYKTSEASKLSYAHTRGKYLYSSILTDNSSDKSCGD